MNVILTVIVTLLIFGFLIAVHELGHYIVARIFKVGIREYSIGMGPKIFQKKGKYNKFTLRALPIGGYVDMVGEAAGDDGSDPEDAGKAPLNTKPVWQRMLIVLAGPFTNIALGLIIMSVIVMFQANIYGTAISRFGAEAISNRNMVYLTGEAEGFEKNDIIFAVNGNFVTAEDGLDAFLEENSGKVEVVVIRRNSNTVINPMSFDEVSLLELDLSYDTETGRFSLEEDSGALEEGDVLHIINGTNILKKTFIEAGDTTPSEQDYIDALLAAYPDPCTVEVLREYKVFLEPETEEKSLESFEGLNIFSDEEGNLRVGKNDRGLVENAIITAVNGKELELGTTPEAFGATYGEGGTLTMLYRWYIPFTNPIVVKDVDLSTLPLGVSGALQAGDEVYKVGSYRTRVYSDLSYGIFNEGIEPTDVVVIRDGKKTTVENVVFYKGSEQGVLYGAMDFAPVKENKDFGTVCYNATFQPLSSLKMTVDSVIQTFSGKYGVEALSGPVGIGEQVGDALSQKEGGGEYLFTLIVLISLSLGICNLLPLPVLDGGRFLLYAIEGVRRKPLSEKVEQILMAISWVLVMGLMIFVMFKDVIGLF